MEPCECSDFLKKGGIEMKKQGKQRANGVKGRQEQGQKGQPSRDNMQPVPQPKDYEDIEY